MAESRVPSATVRAVARTLRVDAATAEVVRAFQAAGVRSIVLKGASFERELHDPGRRRTYRDTDVLVSPRDLGRAGAELAGLGFELQLDHGAHVGVSEPHAQEWSRDPGRVQVDLHWRVPGVDAPAERAWEVLSRRAVKLMVAGVPAEALDRPGVALLVALHAAHHGRTRAWPLHDLERALAIFDAPTWTSSAELASELDACEALAAGLRLTDAGARLADELRLPAVRTPRRVLSAGRPPDGAHGLLRILDAPRGGRARAALAELAPAPALLRVTSPLARRGRVGLALAYPARIATRLWRFPAATRAVRHSRSRAPGIGRAP